MTIAGSLVVGLLAVSAVGCANYAPVASLHRQHQAYLEQLEVQLSLDPERRRQLESMANPSPKVREDLLGQGREARADWYRATFGSARAASVRALSKAVIAKAELGTRSGDEETRATLLNARLGQIQEEFFMESGADALRAKDLSALYLKLVEAVRALRANGVDIQRYLDLGWLERAWTDVHGLDPEKLKAIGDDLKGIAERLRR